MNYAVTGPRRALPWFSGGTLTGSNRFLAGKPPRQRKGFCATKTYLATLRLLPLSRNTTFCAAAFANG
jgi:hypothetical protein